MASLGFRRCEVSPPLTAADKADTAEFSLLAFALLRELARYDADVADRAHDLGLDVRSWPPRQAWRQGSS